MTNEKFWLNKRVFVTGHTGFKGSWLSLWLHRLGAEVTGYALGAPTEPNLFGLCKIDGLVHSVIGDIRDTKRLGVALEESSPEIVIHMAAQPLVHDSYREPVETYAVNVMGTVNLLEAIRSVSSVKALLVVTTDKCYEQDGGAGGHAEGDPLGGYDPYSSSKACAELVTSAYRSSFFNPADYKSHGVAIASARGGNVIGGGDWTRGRLVPDCVRAFLAGEKVLLRNPKAVRPWQHVVGLLGGYLMLTERLYREGPAYGGPWNFGPEEADCKPVVRLVESLTEKWWSDVNFGIDPAAHPHESPFLMLNAAKARRELGWVAGFDIDSSLSMVVRWARAFSRDEDLKEACYRQIAAWEEASAGGAAEGAP